jgi:hypothetical protein
MAGDYTALKTYRYERKFVANQMSRLQTELLVKQNSAFFTSMFYPRQVNNIYFDTPGLDCYFDNLFGNGNRWKARIRWYGEIFGEIKKPILEFKIKKGFVGTKKSFVLPSFVLNEKEFHPHVFQTIFKMAELPPEIHERLKTLQAVLLNSYNRSYFSSINKKFRITVDTELEYNNLRPSWNFFPAPFREIGKTVVELKYDEQWDSEAKEITNEFPFRLDKNSKFVAGMSFFRSEIAE